MNKINDEIEVNENGVFFKIPQETMTIFKYPEYNMKRRSSGWQLSFVKGIWFWSLIWLRKKILKKDNYQ